MQTLSDPAVKVLQSVLDNQDVAKVCHSFHPCPHIPCFLQMNEELQLRSGFFMKAKAELTFGTEHWDRETRQA